MEDSCLQRQPSQPKVAAAGISIFLLEELGDARLRCAQLKKYVDEAFQLIDKSNQREHFFEVAGHLLHGIPDTLLRMDKALSAAAMAAAKLDYEETKDELRPEKVDELERALEEVRVRRVKRRSEITQASAENPMKIPEAVAHLERLAASIEATGVVDSAALANLIVQLEGPSVKTASATQEIASVLRAVSASLLDTTEHRPSRLALASTLRRLFGDTVIFIAAKTSDDTKESRFEEGKPADPTKEMSPEDAKEWKQNTEEHKDNFKAASRTVPLEDAKKGDMVEAEVGVPWPRDSKKEKFTGKVVRVKPNALTVDFTKDHSNPGGHSNEDVGQVDIPLPKKTASADEEKRSRFEEGKPADPTQNMDKDDAAKWKQQTDEHKDEFKSASDEASRWKVEATGPSMSNWKELNGVYIGDSNHHWTWEDDATDTAFIVSEIQGPGIPLYQLRMSTKIDGRPIKLRFKRPPQFRKQAEAFRVASEWFGVIKDWNENPGRGGGIDFTRDWQQDRG